MPERIASRVIWLSCAPNACPCPLLVPSVSLGRTDVQSGGGTYYHLVATYMQGSSMFQGVKTPGANYVTATSRLLDDKLELRFDGQVREGVPEGPSLKLARRLLTWCTWRVQIVPSQDNMSTATVVATCMHLSVHLTPNLDCLSPSSRSCTGPRHRHAAARHHAGAAAAAGRGSC